MYRYKELYTLDFTNVRDYSEIHEEIRDTFDFPAYYGRNWDAFWDCLTNMLGRPINVEVIGLDVIERKFEDTADIIINILGNLKHCYHDEYVNDISVEIVRDNARMKLE